MYSAVFVAALMSCGLYVALAIFSPASAEEIQIVEPIIPAEVKSSATSGVVETTEPSVIPVEPSPPATAEIQPPAPPQPVPQPVQPTVQPPAMENAPPAIDAPAVPIAPPDTGIAPPVGPAPEPVIPPNSKFREARRAIFRDGTEPIWNDFTDKEKAELKKMWDRYQQRRAGKGGNPGDTETPGNR